MAAASVAVVTPPITQARITTITMSAGIAATNVRSTAPQPGKTSSIELPSARRGKPFRTACQ